MRHALSELSTGPVRSGKTVLSAVGDVVRELGCGRAIVIHDESEMTRQALEWLTVSLRKSSIQFRPVEVAIPVHTNQSLLDARTELSALLGGLVITIGAPATMSLGKLVAVDATGGRPPSGDLAGALTRQPLPHIAIPTGLWPPAEGTSVLEIDVDGFGFDDKVRFEDSRLRPVAVIDARVHSVHDAERLDTASRQALVVAACAAANPDTPLDQRTWALAAAHALTAPGIATNLDAQERVGLRAAVSLAAASHPDFEICQRCAAGARLWADEDADSPAIACLRQALLRT